MYPSEARQKGISGEVIVEVLIDESGNTKLQNKMRLVERWSLTTEIRGQRPLLNSEVLSLVRNLV
jgi:outer membrane biosynthesis protein TonB